MNRLLSLAGTCLAAFALTHLAHGADGKRPAEPELACIADGKLRVGMDRADGTLRQLVELPAGGNQLLDRPQPFALWQIDIRQDGATRVLTPEHSPAPRVEPLAGAQAGLRWVWDDVAVNGKESVRVEVLVRVGEQNASLSRWELLLAKPRGVRIKQIRFPRVPALAPRENEVLAVPDHMGAMTGHVRSLLRGDDGKGRRLAWGYQGVYLTMQCLAYYQPDGPGFYAACDDSATYGKTFAMWGDASHQVHFEVAHEPEQEAAEAAEYRLPFGVLLGTFRGDWSAAAALYRESTAARAFAQQGRLLRGLTPDWVRQTGLWVWNRGRSPEVLAPAAELRKQFDVPVSVLWHWWHDCPYDAGFPDYLPPREGTESFRAAMEAAHRDGIHALLYMNQRRWNMNTPSWRNEGAEPFAVLAADGKIRNLPHALMPAPATLMCMGTEFWRNKYAGLAQEAVCGLQADGIYMDEACTASQCYDPRHGHILGPGRYWTEGFGLLALGIRDRCSGRGPLALAGESCGEPWMPYLDLFLVLDKVNHERCQGNPLWEPIPFFQAVYHPSVLCFGNYASLVYPPYDERWPAEKAIPDRLALLDRKFSRQFYLEQARTFVWGIQPMLANFLPAQLGQRPEEMDYVARLVRTRLRAMKYLLDGTWLRPPPLDAPQREVEFAKGGVYWPLTTASKPCPMALSGAWRSADGDVGIALASIDDEPLTLTVPVDAKAYGLTGRPVVYRIDHGGRQRLGELDQLGPSLRLELPPRALWVIEICGGTNDKQQGPAEK